MDEADPTREEPNSSKENEELKAKEKLNQRREARRMKILANAKSRLDRLNGRTNTTNATTPDDPAYRRHNGPNYTPPQSGEYSDPEIEPDILPHQSRNLQADPFIESYFASINRNAHSTPLLGMGEADNSMPFGGGMGATNNAENLFNLFGTPPPPPKPQHILFRARLHLILSALISCLCIVFWRSNGFSIFIPAGLCVITNLLFFREQKPLHPLLGMAALVIPPSLTPHIAKCMHLLGIMQSIIVDLGVFVFSFCTLFYLLHILAKDLIPGLVVTK